MTHEIAKLLLEHAGSAIERQDAIKAALYLGMSQDEITDYLDWIDHLRSDRPADGQCPGENEQSRPSSSD